MAEKNKTRRKVGTRRVRAAKTTIDEGEEVGKTDPAIKLSEKTIVATINWITKTQSSGGLSEWYAKNIEKTTPAKPEAAVWATQKDKNRIPDVPCIDDTRVKLKEIEAAKDYINANIIKAPNDRVYIATQHPLESTFADYWRMIFYEQVENIIVLSSADEKLPDFFPMEAKKFCNHGIFFINTRRVTERKKFEPIQYQVEVLPDGCSNSLIVNVIHYPFWPKNGVPGSTRVLMKLQGTLKTEKKITSPIVVQCSSGLNRAGSFIFTDILTDLVFKNQDPDIPNLIKKLRDQRCQLLQNKSLFTFSCYSFTHHIRIRSNKQLPADCFKDIETFETIIVKELQPIAAKEPPVPGAKKVATTIEE